MPVLGRNLERVAGTTKRCAVCGTARHLGFSFGSFARKAREKSALRREGAGKGTVRTLFLS